MAPKFKRRAPPRFASYEEVLDADALIFIQSARKYTLVDILEYSLKYGSSKVPNKPNKSLFHRPPQFRVEFHG